MLILQIRKKQPKEKKCIVRHARGCSLTISAQHVLRLANTWTASNASKFKSHIASACGCLVVSAAFFCCRSCELIQEPSCILLLR